MNYLDFEQPIGELEAQIKSLRESATSANMSLDKEIEQLEARVVDLQGQIFKTLTDWQIIQLARHMDRPYTLDYLQHAFTDFEELHGDRNFGDDPAIVGGTARLDGMPVMVIGQQKRADYQRKIIS